MCMGHATLRYALCILPSLHYHQEHGDNDDDHYDYDHYKEYAVHKCTEYYMALGTVLYGVCMRSNGS